MNTRRSVSLSELSRGQWADEPPEPPPHPSELNRAHPTALNLVARVRSWLSEQAPLARVQSWLSEQELTGVPSWLGERATRAWSSLTELAPLTFSQYLIAFLIGVVATVIWQPYGRGTKDETAAAIPAALDSVRQSVDKLAAEVTRVRAVEQDILDRISAPPRPVAAPARNPAQQPGR